MSPVDLIIKKEKQDKHAVVQGKQNLRAACLKGKSEFKFFFEPYHWWVCPFHELEFEFELEF